MVLVISCLSWLNGRFYKLNRWEVFGVDIAVPALVLYFFVKFFDLPIMGLRYGVRPVIASGITAERAIIFAFIFGVIFFFTASMYRLLTKKNKS